MQFQDDDSTNHSPANSSTDTHRDSNRVSDCRHIVKNRSSSALKRRMLPYRQESLPPQKRRRIGASKEWVKFITKTVDIVNLNILGLSKLDENEDKKKEHEEVVEEKKEEE